MNRALAMIALVVPPLVLGALLVGVMSWASAWRKSWGSSNGVTMAGAFIAACFLLVHAGYFLAPFLLQTGRAGLGVWLTAPVGALALLAMPIYFLAVSSGPLIPEHATERMLRAAIVIGVPLVYCSPVLVLMRAARGGMS